MSDPFKRAKQIRNGELDEQLPPYEEMTGWFERAPITFLPGLLARIVQLCVVRGVFKEGRLISFVQTAETAGKSLSELREDPR